MMIREMLSDSGEVSSMRVMCFIALFASIFIAGFGLASGADISELSVLCGVFVGASFGGKAAQRFAEGRKDG